MCAMTNWLDQNPFLFIAGPCALESTKQLEDFIQQAPNCIIRAGIYKMRTNPDSFQGLKKEGIEIIKSLKEKYAFKFITEVTDPRQIEELNTICDLFQVGSRNMYNYELLQELDRFNKPVVLKRAFSATVKEWLAAASYMKNLGCEKVILCERGIRTFETSTRNTLDINSVVYLKQNTSYKVIVDPSHGTGNAQMIGPLSHVAVASGADGVMIESHPNPNEALSDKEQAIDIETLKLIHSQLEKLNSFYKKEIY